MRKNLVFSNISFFFLPVLFLTGFIFEGAMPLAANEPAIGGASSPFVQFDPKIPGITQEMLEGAFWLTRIADPDKVIMSIDEISRYNRKNLRECPVLKDLRVYRRILSGHDVREMIEKLSTRPKNKRFIADKEVPDSYFDALKLTLNIDSIPNTVIARYGITVKRTEMRTFPTSERIFSEPKDYEFDRFMETALYPMEPLAILHVSADGQWYLAQAYNYLAWVPVQDVALTDRKTLFDYLDSKDFLVVTGKWVFTGYNPIQPEISELQLDMGVKVPLAHYDEIPSEIAGQHPGGNYVVKLPARDTKGLLEWRLGLISRADDVHVGFLPLTRRNIVMQAFKFLGQRYGWGGMFNARDCSAFIMDHFRSMGVMLPRNASEQGKLALGVKHEMSDTMSLEDRKNLFDSLPAGTPIYMSGHAMLYVGKFAEDYYILHDFASFSALDENGELKRSQARGVLVTPLLATFLSKGKRYIEGLYTAREFILDKRGTCNIIF